jgi:hypothetical protein
VDAQDVGGFGGEFDAGVGDDGHGAPADAVAGADQDRTVVADVPDGRPAPSSSPTPPPSPLSHTEPLTTKREITRRPELSLQACTVRSIAATAPIFVERIRSVNTAVD